MIHKVTVHPIDSQKLHPGDHLSIPVTIQRENCDASVLVGLENLPPGVRQVDQCRISRGESTATCRLHAEADAATVPGQQVVAVASAPGVESVRQPIVLTVTDRDLSSGKGVGPKDSVELGRAKYWNDSHESAGAASAELREEERVLSGDRESYFREAMQGFADPEAPFDPVPRP